VVSGVEVHEDEVIVLNGNLTVEPGGSLTLINCTLLLNCTHAGECWIIVEEGGTLEVLGGSTITSYDPDHEFYFLVLGRLIMRDSTLSECGFNSNYVGLWLHTREGMLLENVTITRCYYGVSIYKSANITIRDCRIVGNEEVGIHCDQSSDILISGCVIGNNRKPLSKGLWLGYSSNITISDCVISRNKWDGAVITHCNYTTMVGCEVSYNGNRGVWLVMCPDAEVINCTIAYNFDGMWVMSYNITIYGCTICHNDDWGLFCEGVGIEVHYCNIYSNGDLGLCNFIGALVNASYCWWHSPNGPEYKRRGDPHNPEEIYSDYGREFLAYEPWLTEPWMPPDEEPPDVVFIEPENGSYVRGSITVRAEASDNEAVDRVELYVNSTLVSRDYETPYQHKWNTTMWPDGLYVLEAVAYDGVGNSNQTAIVVVVDNTPPVIGSVSYSPGEPVGGQEVVVEANISDALSGLARVILWYRVDNDTWTSVEMACSEGIWTATIPGQPAGSRVEFYVEAWDRAGNMARSALTAYQVRPQRPTGLPVAWAATVIVIGAAAALIIVLNKKRR